MVTRYENMDFAKAETICMAIAKGYDILLGTTNIIGNGMRTCFYQAKSDLLSETGYSAYHLFITPIRVVYGDWGLVDNMHKYLESGLLAPICDILIKRDVKTGIVELTIRSGICGVKELL